jgi:hypothetical protein
VYYADMLGKWLRAAGGLPVLIALEIPFGKRDVEIIAMALLPAYLQRGEAKWQSNFKIIMKPWV